MSDNVNRKQEFRKWLDENGVRNPAPALIVQSMDEASEYAYKRKMISNSFWDIKNSSDFNTVRAKLLGMRLFRLIHRNAALIFDKSWKYYVSFLDDEVQRNGSISDTPQNELTSSASFSDESIDMTSATDIRYDSVDENHIDSEISNDLSHIKSLENHLLDRLTQEGIAYHRNGASQMLPGLINISFKDQDGETLLHRLDLLGIQVSTGSACDSVSEQISHVLKAINADLHMATGTIRISLGKSNTIEDIDYIVDALSKIINT